MTKSLHSFTSLFFILMISTFSVFGQDSNELEKQILERGKELILVVVDVKGFANQDDMSVNYKSRHYANIKWLKQNWYEFSKSVREEKSYRVNLNADAYKALSVSEKSKLNELFKNCFAGTFDPVGLVRSQLSKIEYTSKYDNNKDKEQVYQKQQLTEQDIESYAQNKRTVVLVLNSEVAGQINTILEK